MAFGRLLIEDGCLGSELHRGDIAMSMTELKCEGGEVDSR